eukprot:PhM_4_TR13478/c0_g2_i1/m.46725
MVLPSDVWYAVASYVECLATLRSMRCVSSELSHVTNSHMADMLSTEFGVVLSQHDATSLSPCKALHACVSAICPDLNTKDLTSEAEEIISYFIPPEQCKGMAAPRWVRTVRKKASWPDMTRVPGRRAVLPLRQLGGSFSFCVTPHKLHDEFRIGIAVASGWCSGYTVANASLVILSDGNYRLKSGVFKQGQCVMKATGPTYVAGDTVRVTLSLRSEEQGGDDEMLVLWDVYDGTSGAFKAKYSCMATVKRDQQQAYPLVVACFDAQDDVASFHSCGQQEVYQSPAFM